jgi:hypothetical protein
MAVNLILLVIYPTRIILDKTGMGKILFSLDHRVWVWNFVNLSGMDMSKGFSLPVIHWVNYINIYINTIILCFNKYIYLNYINIYSN